MLKLLLLTLGPFLAVTAVRSQDETPPPPPASSLKMDEASSVFFKKQLDRKLALQSEMLRSTSGMTSTPLKDGDAFTFKSSGKYKGRVAGKKESGTWTLTDTYQLELLHKKQTTSYQIMVVGEQLLLASKKRGLILKLE